jgi:lysophospholipase L1-like esterase
MSDAHTPTSVERLGRAAIGAVWLLVLGVAAAVAVEGVLAFRERARPAHTTPARPRYDRLHEAYIPFAVQHLHPVYLFFFPFEPGARAALSNDVVHLDAEGFRGGGPARADGRALGFLVGGSTAFGHFASSDDATISGQLNRLQADAFVVNAGVPSWNSTQELVRLADQLLAHRPALIVSFDGANDVQIAIEHHALGLDLPPGIPESFHRLSEQVDDIRAEPAPIRLSERLFPRLAAALRERLSDSPARRGPPIPEAKLGEAARRYVWNLGLMRDLAESRGARFVPIFQPVLWLHEHAREEDFGAGGAFAGDYRRFHRRVLEEAARAGLGLVDFSRLFDAHFDPVPSFDRAGTRDLTDADIFLDAVHVSDAGNRIVAQAILEVLRADRP